MAAHNNYKEIRFVMRICMSMIALCMFLSACTSVTEQVDEEGAVVHIVLIWLKESGNQGHIQRIIETSSQLNEIPGILEMRVGKSISSERKIVDDSFDVALYMIFENHTSMQQYLVHPEHINAVKTVLKPLASKIRVHDFTSVDL
ncbi:MAG: hypothetical protein GKR92_01520 [Gammaproteobacteria bacterium]|nr:MAG: hypothetical protein GKR92_01520 [Gammaproteobacteria bacterium]